jgi:enamine deaminase RidA (YjgF/YER057c/UK114 family)
VFTAGQIPLTPDGELLDCEPIATQAEQSLSNIEAVLASEGGGDERRVESDRLFR